MPELSTYFWLMVVLITAFSAYDIAYEIWRVARRNRLVKEFNDGTCIECGAEMEQIECKDEYGVYKCPNCGRTVKVDDGDVDFLWNYRKLF